MIELQPAQAVERYPSAVEVMGEPGQPSFSRTGPDWQLSFSRTGQHSPPSLCLREILRRPDSNRRPEGYEPTELPLLHAAFEFITDHPEPVKPFPKTLCLMPS